MRPVEVSLIVCLLLLMVLTTLGAPKTIKQILLLLSLIALALHLFTEGAHWQMFPAYLALFFLVITSILLQQKDREPDKRARLFQKREVGIVFLLCGLSVILSIVFPMFTLPQPTGQYPVGTRTIFLEDSTGTEPANTQPNAKRRLVAQIWYPAELSDNTFSIYRRRREGNLFSSYESVIRTNSRSDAPVNKTGGPFPILIFNHGLGGRRTASTYLTEDLASHGYVVVSIDHPYVASRVEWSDGHVMRATRRFKVEDPESSTAAEAQAEWDKEVELWAADQLFVLNTLEQESKSPESIWYHRLDANRVGAIGHSFGGAAALYVSGADPRFRSAINMDGWTFGGISNRNSDKPVMFIYGDLDSERLDDPSLSRPPRNVTEQLNLIDVSSIKKSLTRYGGYVINIADTDHLDFTDQALVTPFTKLRQREQVGLIKPTEIEKIVRSYVLAFFDKTLLGKPSPMLDSHATPPFPEVTFQRWSPAKEVVAPQQ